MSDAGVQARHAEILSRRRSLTRSCTAISTSRTSAWRRRFRKGRVLLAGDAAHVNNPIGGMGLNGGIQDARQSVPTSSRASCSTASPSALLDLYDLQRRTVAVEFVQEQSIANKKRLEAGDPEVRKRNLDELRAIAADPARARQFLLRTSMIASQRRADCARRWPEA